jgi:hypothetical protein
MKNPNRLPDTLCPECRGDYSLLYASPEKLRKQCLDCGHQWSETPPAAPFHEGQWVRPDILEVA